MADELLVSYYRYAVMREKYEQMGLDLGIFNEVYRPQVTPTDTCGVIQMLKCKLDHATDQMIHNVDQRDES